jgi:hypothetical protein
VVAVGTERGTSFATVTGAGAGRSRMTESTLIVTSASIAAIARYGARLRRIGITRTRRLVPASGCAAASRSRWIAASSRAMKGDQSPRGGVATSGRVASAARITERSSSA